MFNSVIVTHRNRPESLRVFLRSVEIASKYVNPDSYEIVLVDLGSSSAHTWFAEGYANRINLKVHKIPYKGVFWKSKALNYAVNQSQGDYITLVDIDAILPPLFFKGIEEFFSKPENADIKLAHRVRFLDDKTTKLVKDGNFDESFIQTKIIQMQGFFHLARERYTEAEDAATCEEDYQKRALGNSHFTAKKKFWYEIGGCDERFKGRAYEDIDFNSRLFRHLKQGCLRKDPKYIVYHIAHMYEKDWSKKEYTEKNKALYEYNREHGITKIPMGEDWGNFDNVLTE